MPDGTFSSKLSDGLCIAMKTLENVSNGGEKFGDPEFQFCLRLRSQFWRRLQETIKLTSKVASDADEDHDDADTDGDADTDDDADNGNNGNNDKSDDKGDSDDNDDNNGDGINDDVICTEDKDLLEKSRSRWKNLTLFLFPQTHWV